MKSFKIILLLIILVFILSSCAGNQSYLYNTGFLANSHWDMGKAEFQTYSGLITQYDEQRNASFKFILVKEQFDENKFVKSNNGNLSVLKVNIIKTVPTGMYDYFQMGSLFFNVNTGEIIKFAISSQDGCGTTYIEYNSKSNKIIYNSYFDDQGEITRELSGSNFTFYDALPVFLRFELGRKDSYELSLIPSLINNKFIEPEFQDALITNTIITNYKIGYETYPEVYKSEVTYSDNTEAYYFQKDFPHTLIAWEKGNGDYLQLDNSLFIDYWNYTGNKDRHLILVK